MDTKVTESGKNFDFSLQDLNRNNFMNKNTVFIYDFCIFFIYFLFLIFFKFL